MPEGDTIYRSAAALQTWLGGRVINAARTQPTVSYRRGAPPLDLQPIVGRTVVRVHAEGKHLLMRFGPARTGVGDGASSDDLELRTHMVMTGSWHVYAVGATWKRPQRQAGIVLEAGDRIAVCFNVPVMELRTVSDGPAITGQDLGTRQPGLAPQPSVPHLGSDVLGPDFSVDAVLARMHAGSGERAIGEVLLDQRVVAGIGNIYRSEAMFLNGVHPWTSVGACSHEMLRALVISAASLLQRNSDVRGGDAARDFGRGPGRAWVYQRTGRPCHRCGTAIVSGLQGVQQRRAYWCPTCQPRA